jgi:hypothetical protein
MGDRKRWQRIRSPAATEAREIKPANGATSDRGKRFTLSLGELSALTATIGGLTYLLGLFVFALPIRRVYPGDFSEAWYATALVPKTLVAGQGATGMLGVPLGVGVVLVGGFALFDFIGSNREAFRTAWREQKAWSIVLLTELPILVIGSFIGLPSIGIGSILYRVIFIFFIIAFWFAVARTLLVEYLNVRNLAIIDVTYGWSKTGGKRDANCM